MTTPDIDQMKLAALNTPHNISIADTVIDIKVTGFTSTVSLGYTNPTGMLQPAITLQMPTNELNNLAREITAKIQESKLAIREQHDKLYNDL